MKAHTRFALRFAGRAKFGIPPGGGSAGEVSRSVKYQSHYVEISNKEESDKVFHLTLETRIPGEFIIRHDVDLVVPGQSMARRELRIPEPKLAATSLRRITIRSAAAVRKGVPLIDSSEHVEMINTDISALNGRLLPYSRVTMALVALPLVIAVLFLAVRLA